MQRAADRSRNNFPVTSTPTSQLGALSGLPSKLSDFALPFSDAPYFSPCTANVQSSRSVRAFFKKLN